MIDRKLLATVLGLTVLPVVYLAYPIYHAVRVVDQVQTQEAEVHQDFQQIARATSLADSHQPS